MIIITRDMGEGISIGDKIKITLVGIRGRHTKVKIESPSFPNLDQSIQDVKLGDKISFNETISFSILAIRGSKVRFGIESPRDMILIRENRPGMHREDKQNFFKKIATKLGRWLIKISK